MIFNYETPGPEATRLVGTITDGEEVNTFECPILFVDGEQDLEATIAKMQSIHESAKLAEQALGS